MLHSPSEERLFALGWNDKCFFHGCPETYFTRPSTAQERRYLNNDMTTVRGEHLSSTGELAGAAADKEDENPIDWEETLRSDSNTTEEDMFLPQRLPILLQTLPQMLRSSKDWAMDLHGWTANKLLDERRQETSARLQSWLSALFGQTLQSTKTKARTTSRELLQLDGDLDAVATTQFLPTLRRIGALEESSEALERANGDETVVSSRRLTRRKTRDVRRHYLDNISRKLEWDEAEMSTAEMGRTMANSLLSYQGAAGAAAPCSR